MIDTDAIVERIKPHLAGLPAEAQGFILCDLIALWLAGHVCKDDADQTALRRELYAYNFAAIWDLVDLYDRKRKSEAH